MNDLTFGFLIGVASSLVVGNFTFRTEHKITHVGNTEPVCDLPELAFEQIPGGTLFEMPPTCCFTGEELPENPLEARNWVMLSFANGQPSVLASSPEALERYFIQGPLRAKESSDEVEL